MYYFKNALLLLIILLPFLIQLSSCRSEPEFQLKSFQPINPEPAVLRVWIPTGTDAVELEVAGFNDITGSIAFDTVVSEGPADLTFPLALELPKDIYLTLNGQRHNIFMIPGETTEVHLSSGTEPGTFALNFAGVTAIPNRFYVERNQLLKTNHLAQLYSGILGFEDIAQSFAAVDSIGAIRMDQLETAYTSGSIPEWFYRYEKTEIRYDNYLRKAGGINYRELLLGMTGERPILDTLSFDLPVENPQALANKGMWTFLQGWGMYKHCGPDQGRKSASPQPSGDQRNHSGAAGRMKPHPARPIHLQ